MLKALDDHRSAPRVKRQRNRPPAASWSLAGGKISYSIAEAAQLIGVKASTVTAYLNACGLPSFRLGKRRLILADELEKWLRAQAAEGRVDSK
ncbi:helix-turn-helix domain-containing protein [Pseudomonas koreensis]|nr:helix-turn-helix domain-containing protein [Pseudomonas koreensis]